MGIKKLAPKSRDREIKDITELYDSVKKGKYAILALCKNNEPYIVTLSYGFDAENKILYFHCAEQGMKLDFIRENNNVCLTIIDDQGYIKNRCDHAYKTIIIRGRILLIKKKEEKTKAIKILLSHYQESEEKMMRKINTDSESWQKTQMMMCHITQITGKKRIEKI